MSSSSVANAAVRVCHSYNGKVCTVIIDRPAARNAVDGPTARALYKAFKDFEKSSAQVAVLWGANNTFCSGADLKAIGDRSKSNPMEPSRRNAIGPMGPSRMQLSKPVIAAISGYAVAGGLELACWCDMRVAEESSTLGVFCRRWGVPLIDGGTVRLPRLIGHSRAMDLILTGRPIKAPEALDWGLVNRVVPDGTVREAAEALANEIAAFPSITMRSDRQSAIDQWGLSEELAIQNEFSTSFQCVKEAAIEGAARFAKGAGRGGSFEDFKPSKSNL